MDSSGKAVAVKSMNSNDHPKLKVLIRTLGCEMETDRDDSGSQDAEYVWH